MVFPVVRVEVSGGVPVNKVNLNIFKVNFSYLVVRVEVSRYLGVMFNWLFARVFRYLVSGLPFVSVLVMSQNCTGISLY